MKVLILSCGTGGGHNSAALAIKEELDRRDIENEFKEYLEIINTKVKDHINKLYIRTTGKNGKAFKTVYKLGELYRKTKIKSPVYALNSFSKKKLYEYIKENEYDYIVTTHLFAAQALTTIKKQHDIHFVAVATDYVCIPFWEETNPDYFLIPSKELKKSFTDKGIKEEKLVAFGIPVSNYFSISYDKYKQLKELKLDSSKKYILILTGSMGFGDTAKLLKGLLEKSENNLRFIVSCGNNKKLLKTLNEAHQNDNRVIVLPFTKEIYKYMAISEIILTKPGGLTTTEIATLNKPFIHTMPIPGCENYNANFFYEKKMSLKSNTIEETIYNTYKLLNDKTLQKEIISNQSKYIDKEACKKICDFIEEQYRKQ